MGRFHKSPRQALDINLTETDFDLGSWTVTQEMVGQYLEAVGDANPQYYAYRLVPPLALAAYALGALLKRLDLPPGAIHSLQEVETLQPVGFDQEIKATARLERPRRRGDLEFISAGYRLEDSQGRPVQAGKGTVLISRSGQG
jgi:acyl dehydratase